MERLSTLKFYNSIFDLDFMNGYPVSQNIRSYLKINVSSIYFNHQNQGSSDTTLSKGALKELRHISFTEDLSEFRQIFLRI
ncbi:hypothetical protein LEP1GSC036_1454 [Leptospira weilii str. 2006001853]|uniref:Uncharacterized protein n=3 Tax=Leptospira weilii TaxID=28184 RepID=A0A828Z8I0_9LEPT|nr:hypothetical protein LEP1GSC036_1454 [Leptospira weilii str. 2006001853]EMJ60167.1 hypothetical protein LEP1GSC051_1595 [Leptospira sp. P2653]EMM74238.1 hypothetical protein LEP1GSC038_4702 [Leptospira weilii str. 2006001855]EMN45991.1 hypothetical protein LEP1GSC086_2203 [Leptospira weilii str. LNT 1234]EMN91834.1 hypothetical protein LEP1GSC108_1816 [Leptospira weilii str. UI 13098]OMI15182.1 hypothetical protein BUQ74_20040 [Leptospira weilii serovar Heyan]QDK21510.1 hypothetical protei